MILPINQVNWKFSQNSRKMVPKEIGVATLLSAFISGLDVSRMFPERAPALSELFKLQKSTKIGDVGYRKTTFFNENIIIKREIEITW